MRLDCDVVLDLLPSYLQETTCDTTNRLVGEHLACCETCQAALGQLRSGSQPKAGRPDYPRLLRRRNIAIMVLSAALTLSIVTACLLGLAQSGGYQRVDALRAQDFFTATLLELPLAYDKGIPDGDRSTTFLSGEDAPALAARIEELQCGVTAQAFGGDAVLLTQPQAEGPDCLYLLDRLQGQNAWRLSGMGAQFEKRTPEGILERSFEIIFPYHLLSDERLSNGRSVCELEENYRTDYGAADFLAFYRALDRYQIVQTEDGFVIQGYSDPMADYRVADFPISFQFGKLGEQTYVSVHYS